MNDNDGDGGFTPSFPCFCISSDNEKGGSFESAGPGQLALILLTDDDLLDRYVLEKEYLGNAVQTIDSPAELLTMLDRLPPQVGLVTFDPVGGNNLYWPVAQVRSYLLDFPAS